LHQLPITLRDFKVDRLHLTTSLLLLLQAIFSLLKGFYNLLSPLSTIRVAASVLSLVNLHPEAATHVQPPPPLITISLYKNDLFVAL
jgi:hypothetical protein